MSGLYYASKSTGKRTPIMPPTPLRTTRAQANQDELNLKRAMGLSEALEKQAAPPKQPRRGRPRRRAASISSEESADGDVEEDSEEGEDASEDDDQSDVDEPVLYAPALVPSGRESGRFSVETTSMRPLDDEVSLFDNMNSDDDNDDAIYQRVEEISDYDDEEDERQDEDELTAAWEAEAEQDPDLILDQLDENSVYGFAADFDSGEEFVAFSSESDNMPEIEVKRRVHFSVEGMLPRLATESLSPVLTRTLLPSVLPPLDISAAQNASGLAGSADATQGDPEPDEEDDYDSDATADNLPPEAHTATPIIPHPAFEELASAPAASPSPSLKRKNGKKQKQKTPRPKGPRAGTFIVDQDKPWGILDASGKRVVMLPAPDSQRHDWLDAKLRQDYDDPGNADLGQMLDESDGSVTSSQDVMETVEGKADIMIAGLNSNGNNAGQATGPSEAFYPPTGFQVAGDYIVSQEELAQSFSDTDEGDIHVDLGAFVAFDNETSDDEDKPAINMPPISELPGYAISDEYSHLNNRNVTAFRRNADSAQAVLNTTPTFSSFQQSEASSQRPRTPKTGTKRKASNLPYQSPVYQGVTPVQRHVWHPTKRTKTTPRVDDTK